MSVWVELWCVLSVDLVMRRERGMEQQQKPRAISHQWVVDVLWVVRMSQWRATQSDSLMSHLHHPEGEMSVCVLLLKASVQSLDCKRWLRVVRVAVSE